MSSTRTGARRILDVAAVAVFAAAVAAPAIDMALRPAAARDSRRENRVPAPFPPAPRSFVEAAAWPQGFKAYFNDTFGLRDRLLGVRNTALLDLRVSPTPMLDVGPTGWIFYRGDMEFEMQRGSFHFPPSAIDAWVEALEDRRVRLATRGARFVFALAPDKEVIYPEFRPARWEPVGPTMGDLLLKELARRTQVDVLDLRPALWAAKAFDRPEVEDYVYFPRGTHWTSRGACAANTVILERLRTWFPDLAPLDCASMQSLTLGEGGEDSWLHNLYAPWRLRPFHFIQPEHGWDADLGQIPSGPLGTGIADGRDPAAPSILFLHDSYGPFLHPFLAQRARRLRSQWQSWVPEDVVDVERPDVVLMVKAERMLSQPPEADKHTVARPLDAPAEPDAKVWSLVGAPEFPRIVGNARMEAGADCVVWTTQDRMDHFVARATRAVDPAESMVVSYEIDAPAKGHLEVWASRTGTVGWAGKNSVHVPLVAGRNAGEVLLPVQGFGGEALVRLGPPGEWRIRRLEMRASVRALPGRAVRPR